MRNSICLCIALWAVSATACAAAELPVAYFAKFYPTSLATDSGIVVPSADRKTTFAMAGLNKGGSPLGVAVFSNGIRAALSVISLAGQGVVLATIEPDGMTGRSANLALIDLDSSGSRKIVVAMQQMRGGETTWIFTWTGAVLKNIGPVINDPDGEKETDLGDVTFADLDGTGRISIIDRHAGIGTAEDGTSEAHEDLRVFRYVNGSFEQSATADFMRAFSLGKGAPVAQSATFDVADPDRARQVVILNGCNPLPADDAGKDNCQVTSAAITLNGQTIASEKDFNGKTTVIRVTTGVHAHNEVSAKINGKPGSTLTILIMPKS